MRAARTWILFPLALLSWGCGDEESPESQLGAASRELAASASPDSLGDLSPADAEQLVRAWELLQRVDPEGSYRRYPVDEPLRALVERARRGPGGGPTPAGGAPDAGQLARLPAAQRASLARALEGQIHEISERVALSAADAAVSRQLRAEAELRVLRADLERAAGPGAGVPADALELASRRTLERTRLELRAHRRVLAEHLARFGSPETRGMLEVLDRRIGRMTDILSSPGYAAYERGARAVLERADPARWAALAADREARTAAELARLQREFAAAHPRYRQAMAVLERIRGPPADPVARTVFEALRDYDLDVRRWSHAEASLRGLAREIHAAAGDAPSGRAADWRRSVVSLLDAPSLEAAHRLSVRLEAAERAGDLGVPADPSAPHARHSRALWREALTAEVQARARGSAPRERTAEVRARLARHLGGTLSPAGEGELLSTLQERFGRADQMPRSAREDMRAVVSRVKAQHAATLDGYVRDLRVISDRMALSTQPVGAEVREQHGRLRAELVAYAQGVQAYADAAERLGVAPHTPAEQKATRTVLAVQGPRPPPDAGGTAPLPLSRPLPPRPGDGVVLQTDPAVERARTRAYQLLRDLDRRTASLSGEPIQYSEVAGARVARESALLHAPADWSTTRASSRTRHPDGFNGLLAADGRPYLYHSTVKDFRDFRAVGGGIHLGDTLAWTGPRPEPGSALVYDLAGRELRLVTAGGGAFVLQVEPDVLKALYRFVRSGRNAAISLGWSGERESLRDRLGSLQRQRVLLDPYLVDTRVGQDLVRADQLPWRLGEPTLPGGTPNLFWREFARADSADRGATANPFHALFAGVTPFAEGDRAAWATRVGRGSQYAGFITPFLRAESTAQAVAEIRVAIAAGGRDGDEMIRFLQSLPPDPLDALDEVLAHLLDGMAEQGGFEPEVLRLWAARALVGRARSPGGLARARAELEAVASFLLGAPTVAVLLDEPTAARLDGGRVVLRPTLRYRYATRWIQADAAGIRLSHAPGDSTRQARTLPGVTAVANRALPTLLDGYMPLRRVSEYAALAAFLRWAGSSRDLYLLDLSDLAAVPASDGRRFPTPDLLELEWEP
ncbi:MAG TPA: hypothetical protein VFT45_08890 [Longimicrobium sp.]|nr:hypothetical protein [Longimicrobium sp.]